MNSDPKFKDPAKIKSQRPEDKPKDGKNSPWNFACPPYDQRSSVWVNAGTNYGVGHKNPVGHTGNPKVNVDTLPYGRNTPTMQVDETR